MDSEKFSVRGHALSGKLQKRVAAICQVPAADQKMHDVANWLRKNITIEATNSNRDAVILVAAVQAIMLIGDAELRIGITDPDSDRWHMSITSDGGVNPKLHSTSLEHLRVFEVTGITI